MSIRVQLTLKRVWTDAWLLPCTAGMITCVIIAAGLWTVDRIETRRYCEEVRTRTLRELSAARGVAENAINKRVFLTLGLKAHVAVTPDIGPAQFADYAATIISQASGIRSVTLIKDNVISDVYPRFGNEGAIGLKLLAHPAQREAALRSIESGKPWLAGPIKLVQGGEAFVDRAPVYEIAAQGESGRGRYWGMVSILIDKETLIDEVTSGVPKNLKIAIRGKDGLGAKGDYFLGDTSIESLQPLDLDISLPTGAWQIQGAPSQGWPSAAPMSTTLRYGGGLAALLTGLLVTLTLRSTTLASRSQHHAAGIVRQLDEQDALLRESNSKLRTRARSMEESRRAALNMMFDIERAREDVVKTNDRLAVEAKERDRAELALKQYTERLARSNAELEQFAYIASHDLKEPLRKVSSFCGILKEDYGDKIDETGQQYMDYVVDGAERMRTLINDLLQFSRVNTPQEPTGETDMNQALADALFNLEGAIEEADADVTYGDLPTLTADQRQMTQLLQNLIGNAIKYRGETRPIVRIEVDTNDREWIFSVSDNGIGIEPQFHEKVFGIFKRLHARGEYSGTGIGLAICKKIVDRQHGRIWIEPTDDGGTTFRFSLPKIASRHLMATEDVT